MEKSLMEKLLDLGAYFGHVKRRRHPSMKDYIFSIRSGVHIIDLDKTVPMLEDFSRKFQVLYSQGVKILFVCTKKQMKKIATDFAKNARFYYVVERWLGGTLTNFDTMKKRLNYYRNLKREKQISQFSQYPKNERIKKEKELLKLARFLEGISDMEKLPDAVFVVDGNLDDIAIKEANKMNIPVYGIADTNVDVRRYAAFIPSNDDSVKTVGFILQFLLDKLNKEKAPISKDTSETYENKFEEK